MSVFNNTTGLQEIINIINALPNESVAGDSSGGLIDRIAVDSSGLITAYSGENSRTYQLSSSDDTDFIANNILEGVNIFGVTGTATIDSISVSNDGTITATCGGISKTLKLSKSHDSDFIASNIKNGINIFGVAGTYEPSTTTLNATANGTYTPSGYDGYSSVTVAIPVYSGN